MDRTTCHEGQSVRKLLDRALPVCFFTGLFVYVWMAIEPRLLYYGFGVFAEFPRFSWEGMFLKVSLCTPGGPLSLLVGFLAQWYYQSWLGAIIIIASLWVLFSGTRRLFQEVDADAGPDLAFVPPLLGVLILNRYDHPLQAVLAVAMSAWTAAVYLSLPLKGIAGRAVPFAFLYGLCYYVMGGPAVVFGLTACLAEGLSRRRAVSAAACAVLAVAATLAIGVWALSLDPHEAFRVATPFDPGAVAGLGRTSRWLLWGLYAFTPLAVAGTWAWGWLASRIALWRGQKRVSAGQPEVNRARPRRLWPRVGLRWLTVGVLCIACMADRHVGTKCGLAMHDLARQRQWSEVLRLADRMRGRYPLTPASIFEVDRAMAHLGRMGDDMFKYPHEARALAFLGSDELGLQLRFAKLIDLHFDLGDLNAAEQDAYELLEAQGPSPFILEALARVHMAKAEYEAASVVLRTLQRSPAYRATASRWLEEIGQPSRLAVDVDIASWQRWRRRTDHEVRAVPYDQILLELLHDHPDNRMAFEYLTAYYLLRNMRAELVANLHRVRDLGYGHLPRHYAEALVVHLNQTRQPFDLRGWTLDPGLTDQLRQIVGTWKDTAGDRQAAMAALGPRFGDTYTFYSIFNISGVK